MGKGWKVKLKDLKIVFGFAWEGAVNGNLEVFLCNVD